MAQSKTRVVHCRICDSNALLKVWTCDCSEIVSRDCICEESGFPKMENKCGQEGDPSDHEGVKT